MQRDKLWIVGKPLLVDGKEIGWMPEGIFHDEETAAAVATEDEFIALITVGERLPEIALDAEKLYFPRQESWGKSALYMKRNPK